MAASEVARLMQQIDLEYEAAQQGLEGMAITARHAFITARMERIAEHHHTLARLVDTQEARTLLGIGANTDEEEH